MTSETHWILGWIVAVVIATVATAREQGLKRRITILEDFGEHADIWLVLVDLRQRIETLERTRRPLTHVMEEAIEQRN